MSDRVRTARRVFRIAGIYGLIVLLPMFFMEETVANAMPPALTHPNIITASSAPRQ